MFKIYFIVWLLAGLAMTTAVYGADAEGAAADKQAAPSFDIWEYRVKGNTLLKREDVERTVYPYLGRAKGIQDIEKARAALEKRYHQAGYATVLVNIPQQSVNNGVVYLNVVEGKVDRLLVTGSRYFSLQKIRDEVPALAEGKVPYLPKAQTQLVALNKMSADRVVTPVLRPGRTPGTVIVELKVQDHFPLHGSLELNDQYSVDTTRLRLSGMVRYDNLWQKQHSLSVQYQTSPDNTSEVKVLSATYLARSAGSDNVLAIYGVRSDSNTATVGTLAVIGKGDIVGLRGIMPWQTSKEYFHSLTFGVDYKNFKESVLLQGADSVNTPISYVPFTVQYGGTLQSAASRTQFDISANFSIRGLGNNSQDFENKRFNARSDYIYLRADVDRSQDIYKGFGLRLKAEGQVTDSPLISSEEFSAGGANTVRGYHESERLGDDGILGSVELRSPSLVPGRWSTHLQKLRAHVFWDGAHLRVREALSGQESHFQLSSAGFGIRMQAWRHLNASLDWAQVFFGTGSVHDHGRRIHFDVEYAF